MFAGSILENDDHYFRPLYGAVGFRVMRRRPGATRSVVAAKRRFENRGGERVVTDDVAPRLSLGASSIATDFKRPMGDDAAPRQPSGIRVNAAKWVPWRCRLEMGRAISFVTSSARCSFPTAHLYHLKSGSFMNMLRDLLKIAVDSTSKAKL